MTGIVSTYRHSLQWGLSIPLAAAILMLGLSLYYILFLRVPALQRRATEPVAMGNQP